jgi:Na+-driven multidrug efflux pump
MSTKKKYSIDMVNGPLAIKILRFALPFMMANMIQRLFNAADIVVVGKFAGDTALAAVSSTGPLIQLIVKLVELLVKYLVHLLLIAITMVKYLDIELQESWDILITLVQL